MRSTTEYKGWTIDIRSFLHKHFSKGANFSASADIAKKASSADGLGAGLERVPASGLETMTFASEVHHCTVDQAEAEVLARAMGAVDKRESEDETCRAPPAANRV